MTGADGLAGTIPGRQRPGIDILLVLGVSLGQSAVYSLLSLIRKLTYEVPLNQQTTTMNPSITPDQPWLDLTYQIAGIVFPLVPAMLALYLLHLAGQRRQIGFELSFASLGHLVGIHGVQYVGNVFRHALARPRRFDTSLAVKFIVHRNGYVHHLIVSREHEVRVLVYRSGRSAVQVLTR